jgi:probable rRNA maturation factor
MEQMNIIIDDQQTALQINEEAVRKLAIAVLACEKQKAHELTIHFVSEQEIAALHADYFDDPTVTDCISFPIDDATEIHYRVLGEIFVCPQVAVDYAAQHQGNPYEETSLYIVHGILHLLGYNDIEEQERAQMRLAEQRVMQYLRSKQVILCPF